MKRGKLLKGILSVALVVFMANGLLGQIPAVFDPISGDNTVAIDSVTVGNTTPYWVEPDSYYHPNFAGTGALTAGFVWNWVATPAAGTSLTVTNNYVEIDWSAEGLFNITVNEEAPVALGGCSSADTNMYVRVIAAPSVTYTADNPGTIIGANLTVCEGDADLAGVVQAAITSVAGPSPEVQLAYSYTVETENSGGAVTQQSQTIYQGSDGSQITGINAATYDLFKPAGGFVAMDPGSGKEKTIYTYVINGVTDRISRKSDYIDNTAGAATGWDWYDTTAETIVVTVNPTPVTGPIYHIPNGWAD